MLSKRRKGYEQIGEFIFQFSQLEFTIRTQLSNVLNLSDDQFDVVTGPYDFSILCTVSKAILTQKFPENKAVLEKIFNRCRALNEERVRVAHGMWILGNAGLVSRHVPRQSLKATYFYEDPSKLAGLAQEAKEIMVSLFSLHRHNTANVEIVGIEIIKPGSRKAKKN